MHPSDWFCQPCNRTLKVTAATRDAHLNGKKHARKVDTAAPGGQCNICRTGVMDCAGQQAHLKGKKHLANIAALARPPVNREKQSHLVGPLFHILNGSGGTGRPLSIRPAETKATTLQALPWGTNPSVRRCGPTKLQALARGLQTTSGGVHIAKGPGITSTSIFPPISDTGSARDSQKYPMTPKKMHTANRVKAPPCLYKLGSTVVPPRPVPGPSKATTPSCRQGLICVTGQGRIMSTDSLRHSTPNTQRVRPRKPGQPKKGVPPPFPRNMPAAVYPREHPGFGHSQRTSHLGPAVTNHQKMASRTHTCSRRRCISQRPYEAYSSASGDINHRPLILRRRNPRKDTQQSTRGKGWCT